MTKNELYPTKLFAIIPEKFIAESDETQVEFEAKVILGRCDNNNTRALAITVMKDGSALNGIQFIADLNFSPSVSGGD